MLGIDIELLYSTEMKSGCGSNVLYKFGFSGQPVGENTYCTQDETSVNHPDQNVCNASCARNHSYVACTWTCVRERWGEILISCTERKPGCGSYVINKENCACMCFSACIFDLSIFVEGSGASWWQCRMEYMHTSRSGSSIHIQFNVFIP